MNDSRSTKLAVLLLAHGSPATADEIPEYLRYVTSGRSLPHSVIDEITHRYSQVGFSPLTSLTLQQGSELAKVLQLPVYVAMRNWKPFIPDVVRTMHAEGVRRAVAICLAPQNSQTSVGLYRKAVEDENALLELDFVESWHDHPLLAKAFAEKLRAGWSSACWEAKSQLPIIFTAHSVPERTITDGDPYQRQAHETARLVAREVGLKPADWVFAFQSQGMSGGPWIGPTVEDTIRRLKEQGHAGVFVQPVGFLCDHVEILYDIDIGFRQFAAHNAMRLWRAESLNTSPELIAALADIARSRIKSVSPTVPA